VVSLAGPSPFPRENIQIAPMKYGTPEKTMHVTKSRFRIFEESQCSDRLREAIEAMVTQWGAQIAWGDE
jgi:hypothetical protein